MTQATTFLTKTDKDIRKLMDKIHELATSTDVSASDRQAYLSAISATLEKLRVATVTTEHQDPSIPLKGIELNITSISKIAQAKVSQIPWHPFHKRRAERKIHQQILTLTTNTPDLYQEYQCALANDKVLAFKNSSA